MQCKKCTQKFEKSSFKEFCSRSCFTSYHNMGKKRNKPVNLICKECQKTYQRDKSHSSRTYCKSCQTQLKVKLDYKSKTIQQCIELISVKGKHPSWNSAHIRNFNRSWNKNLLKEPCQVCGYNLHIELAHIKSISSFDKNTQLSVVNSPDNILVLCPNHHWEFDNGKLPLSSIPKRKC